jgi:hypothetical protein
LSTGAAGQFRHRLAGGPRGRFLPAGQSGITDENSSLTGSSVFVAVAIGILLWAIAAIGAAVTITG